VNLGPEVRQFLYVANRWERVQDLRHWLNQKKVVIADRYVPSGLVYGLANGLELDWMVNLEKGADDIMIELIAVILSYIGAFLLLLALALRNQEPWIVDVLNFVGSLALVIWALFFSVWAFVILDGAWVAIAGYNLIQDLRKRGGKKNES